jgi:hypothetical protein
LQRAGQLLSIKFASYRSDIICSFRFKIIQYYSMQQLRYPVGNPEELRIHVQSLKSKQDGNK